jgi:dihydroxy-acid dehydratase
VTPEQIMTPENFENALRTLLAVGGSTNALIHLTAIAGRLGIELSLRRFDELGRETPLLVDLKPSGQHYMQELFEAGGFPSIRRELAPLLQLDAPTVAGLSHRQLLKPTSVPEQRVVRSLQDPLSETASIAVLFGNLAVRGAVIKQSAASRELLQHSGRAVVFDGLEDLGSRIDAPGLEVDANDVLVLRGAGPIGAPGMPEAGYIPIPKKLAAKGVKDMVRISDARMSGTAFGTVVLHVAPEAALGGSLALLKTGDTITLDAANRRLDVALDDHEIEYRREQWLRFPPNQPPKRGYARLFTEQVMQAPEGCDFEFLRG